MREQTRQNVQLQRGDFINKGALSSGLKSDVGHGTTGGHLLVILVQPENAPRDRS